MNSIVPVGNGFLLLLGDERTAHESHERVKRAWEGYFPSIPFMVLGPASLQQLNEKQLVFSFEGDSLKPETVAEFQAWWSARWPEHDTAIPARPAVDAGCDTC